MPRSNRYQDPGKRPDLARADVGTRTPVVRLEPGMTLVERESGGLIT